MGGKSLIHTQGADTFSQFLFEFQFYSKSLLNIVFNLKARLMKKTIVLLAVSVLSATAFGQKLREKQVPSPVTAAFRQQHADAKDVDWEKENGNYEAEFKEGQTELSVVYDAQGHLLETEVEISESELPSKAKEYIAQKYSGIKIKEAARITDSQGNVSYEAEVNKKDLIFDSNGTFIKVDTESDAEDNED